MDRRQFGFHNAPLVSAHRMRGRGARLHRTVWSAGLSRVVSHIRGNSPQSEGKAEDRAIANGEIGGQANFGLLDRFFNPCTPEMGGASPPNEGDDYTVGGHVDFRRFAGKYGERQ